MDHHHSEFPEWEFLNNSDVSLLNFPPQLPSPLINPNHFSLHSPNHSVPNSNSETEPSDVDRNSEDSYVSDQLFPAGEPYLMKESSSSSVAVVDDITTRSTSELLLDDVTGVGGGGGGGFDSKEEVEELVERATSVEEEEKEENRRVVWWKVPFEVFKYWVVRVSPVPMWSLSMAATAAFLGLVILRRRLYKMKRKTQTLKLNVALDDKKVSQLMGRVARLNEAFSAVRHVPVVRPSVPATSVILRPVMSMR
ncbi:PREDICTED: uncharacterized protein LOC109331214 isoform X2 [Lupinus angustifolius]|uniref:uncharacterized protein LOC109331214 isoform X2 n=1 Tax=Lupinus angustifolius TaxID=3871 RepID=UPI00092F1378|nr:PREDICTED: uncharacterized protein LOC109331214 isoform X2 [Lupinus angustifolius]